MASLFGKNQLRELAQKISTEDIQPFLEIVRQWHNDYHNGSLKQDKETSREQEYNHAFFKTILGYKEKPSVPYSFEPKATTDKGQLPDAIIGYIDPAEDIKNIAAVVELKGAGIDLDRPQRREGNMSPVQQGFKYKTQYRSVPFVIISNFWEFRLYHDNMLDYESWTLDELVDPTDDYIRFKQWYILHRRDSLATKGGQSKTEALITDIRIEQENIGKKFYRIYKEARLDLLRTIYKNNAAVRSDLDRGIQKAQKIIDRIVFAAFAEDRGLLPDNTLHKVLASTDNSVFGGSLWSALKGFFEAIDKGSEKLEIPNGYNGGLFAFDPELNVLQIDDEPLRRVVGLANYNFAEDLSVKILGHIFEQSISDLEEIKNKVAESKDLETIAQGRRKKDGIFYTPDYIVRYIVDNSLGAYLREHEEKFKEEYGLKGDIQEKTYEKREKQAYQKYQDFLQNIKVVDPACGSGAFLVYVFDYLLAENQRVGDILGNTLFSTDEYIRDILRNNIYGVDLNEESVEITKLSLWLKTAQKGKKLTTLDSNIKCGNSLIDDPEVADDKAFNWHEQFADVFKNGGFDVVVGNPPYGAKMPHEVMAYFTKQYETTKYKLETYSLFTELGLKLLRGGGYLSFIMPYTWLTIQQHSKLRELVLCNNLVRILDLPTKVFADADLDTVVFVVNKSSLGSHVLIEHMDGKGGVDKSAITTATIMNSPDLLINISLSDSDSRLVEKIKLQHQLRDSFEVSQGYIPYRRSDLVVSYGEIEGNAIVDERKWHASIKVTDEYKREIAGKDLARYTAELSTEMYVKYGKHVASYVNPKFFTSPRILIMEVTRGSRYKLTAAYTDEEYYNSPSIINVIHPENNTDSLLSLLAVLNSSLISWYHTKVNPKANAKTSIPKILVGDVRNLPILESNNDLTNLAASSMGLRKQLAERSGIFKKLIAAEFPSHNWSAAMNRWWLLDFTDFVQALKLKLSLSQKDDLLQLFDKYRVELSALDTQIQSTDRQIDQLVHQLYGLTPEEIAIVEGEGIE